MEFCTAAELIHIGILICAFHRHNTRIPQPEAAGFDRAQDILGARRRRDIEISR